MLWMLIFNALMLALIGAALGGVIPPVLYQSFLRGLHFTIGISPPTERQMRWTLAVWFISVLVIVDGIALLLQYV